MSLYDRYPAVDANGSFPPEVRGALRDSQEFMSQYADKQETEETIDLKVSKGELILNVKDLGALGDEVSDDTDAIQSAIDFAISSGKTIYWPLGTYLKNGNLTGFHTVKHQGPGVIKSDSSLFYVEPNGVQENILHVSTILASDTYDGLSPNTPIRKIGTAVNALANYGPILDGFWIIKLTTGTWSDRTKVSVGLDSINPITVTGPLVNHPNTPTAIITEGYNAGAVGFSIRDAEAQFIISNIHFIGYNGTASSAGIQSSDVGKETQLVNCHFTDCYWGYSNQASKGDVKGGIYRRCGYLGDTANTTDKALRNGNGGGYRGLMGARHSIGVQSAGTLANGPYFYDCVAGVFVQETCTGHVDFSTFEDCATGISVKVNSRVNADGSSFKRNTIDISLNGNSHAYLSPNTLFGTGVNESGSKINLGAGSQCVDASRIFTNIDQSYSNSVQHTDIQFPNRVVTSTTLTEVYKVILGGMLWRDKKNTAVIPKQINLKIRGELFGTQGTKEVAIRLGSPTSSVTFTAEEVGIFEADVIIYFKEWASQLVLIDATRHLGTIVRHTSTTMSNQLTTDTPLTVESKVSNSNDSIRFDVLDLSWG